MTFQTITVTPGSGATINTLPNSGQQTSANSLPVVIASDQAPLTIAGDVPSGATNSGNPIQCGAIAITQEQAAVVDGGRIGLVADAVGKLINMPFSNKENWVRGSGFSAGVAPVTLLAAQGVGKRIYVASVQLGNTGSNTSIITLNDTTGTGSGTRLINQAGAVRSCSFSPPLVVGPNTALTFTPSVGSATQYVSAQGFFGI